MTGSTSAATSPPSTARFGSTSPPSTPPPAPWYPTGARSPTARSRRSPPPTHGLRGGRLRERQRAGAEAAGLVLCGHRSAQFLGAAGGRRLRLGPHHDPGRDEGRRRRPVLHPELGRGLRHGRRRRDHRADPALGRQRRDQGLQSGRDQLADHRRHLRLRLRLRLRHRWLLRRQLLPEPRGRFDPLGGRLPGRHLRRRARRQRRVHREPRPQLHDDRRLRRHEPADPLAARQRLHQLPDRSEQRPERVRLELQEPAGPEHAALLPRPWFGHRQRSVPGGVERRQLGWLRGYGR